MTTTLSSPVQVVIYNCEGGLETASDFLNCSY